jgi:hypothetical protein
MKITYIEIDLNGSVLEWKGVLGFYIIFILFLWMEMYKSMIHQSNYMCYVSLYKKSWVQIPLEIWEQFPACDQAQSRYKIAYNITEICFIKKMYEVTALISPRRKQIITPNSSIMKYKNSHCYNYKSRMNNGSIQVGKKHYLAN